MKKNPPKEWQDANRENWDKRVPIHLGATSYDLTPLRSGRGELFPIDEVLLPDVERKKILHLQCHFGRDTLVLAQKGADVTGVDFSMPAIKTARQIAGELGLAHRANFVVCNLYDAPDHVFDAGAYDIVYTTWGTIGWLPDIDRWARVIAHFLKPGGQLIFADGHPTALVFDDVEKEKDGRPGWFVPYFFDDTFVDQDSPDYTGDHPIVPGKTFEWMHKVSDILRALLDAGLVIEDFQEYDAVVWPMFSMLEKGGDGLYRWPDKPWFPLSLSITARKPD